MPLIKGKSKQAFSENVATEMKHGKPQKQALAIAYATQRKAGKKMAKGGMANKHAVESPMHSQEEIHMLKHDDPAHIEHDYGMRKDYRNFAEGGEVESLSQSKRQGQKGPSDPKHIHADNDMARSTHSEDREATTSPSHESGMLSDEDLHSLADIIMERRRIKHMADGGMVDLEENAEEEPMEYETLNMEAAEKELYDDSQLKSQPMDSNEHGDKIESDANDMVDKLRNRMRMRRGY